MAENTSANGLPDFDRQVYCLLGLPFDAVTVNQATERLRASARDRIRCLLVTPNLNFIALSRQDAGFRDALLKNDLSLVDGMPLVWCARLLGIPLRQRVSGSTLFETLADDPRGPDRPGMSVFLFGADEGVATLADQNLNAGDRSVRSVGYIEPGYGDIPTLSAPWMLDRINHSRADFLVVCLGARKGHLWIDHNLDRLQVPIVSHLGAVIKFTAGVVARAPGWMQRIGLEWLWRIKEEPPLWARYAQDGLAVASLVLGRLLPGALHRLVHRPDDRDLAKARLSLERVGAALRLRLAGPWCEANAKPLRGLLKRVAASDRPVELDLGTASYLDSATIALLLLLRGLCIARRRSMRVRAASPAARRMLRHHCAEYLLDGVPGDRPRVPVPARTETEMAPTEAIDR